MREAFDIFAITIIKIWILIAAFIIGLSPLMIALYIIYRYC